MATFKIPIDNDQIAEKLRAAFKASDVKLQKDLDILFNGGDLVSGHQSEGMMLSTSRNYSYRYGRR